MGLRDRGLLFQRGVAADRRVNEHAADEDKDRAEQDCGDRLKRTEISAADELRVNEGEPSAKEGESEDGQKNSRPFGRLSHFLILEAFERYGVKTLGGFAFAVIPEPMDRFVGRAPARKKRRRTQ